MENPPKYSRRSFLKSSGKNVSLGAAFLTAKKLGTSFFETNEKKIEFNSETVKGASIVYKQDPFLPPEQKFGRSEFEAMNRMGIQHGQTWNPVGRTGTRKRNI